MITFRCQCGKTYKVDDKHAGRQTRCMQCGGDITIPTADEGQTLSQTQVDVTQPDVTSSFAEPAKESGATESFVPTPQCHTPDAANDVTVEYTPAAQEDSLQKNHESLQKNRETSRPASTTGQKHPKSSHERDYGCHRIMRTHARGGMGQVSIARDENLKREVALKELFENATGRKDIVQRFFDEAEITARLEHPGIVPVHAFGTDGKGRPFYTMKLVRGKTFQEAIKEHHILPDKDPGKTASFRELVRRFASVCQTMSFAHDKGIIHRDLKPANIMLGEHGETLVMDWGLAKPFAESDDGTLGDLAADKLNGRPEMTGAGKIVGTPAYMSPEQVAGDQLLISPQSDIYSLGAILYQILTDQLPYTGKSSLEIVQKVLSEEPPRPSEVMKGVPKGLEAICLKAMAREQSNRYLTASAMFKDLTNWLDDEPISAKKDTRWEKTWRWMRKNRTLATTLLLAMFTFVIVLGVSGVMIERARAKTVAANMLADEMRRRAEEALKLAAEKEKELAVKEKELEEAYADMITLATASEEERHTVQIRIDNLIREIDVLEQGIMELQAVADGYSDSDESSSPQSMDSYLKRVYQKRISQLIDDISKYNEKTMKLVESVTLKRDTILELQNKSRASNDESEKSEIAKQAKSLQDAYMDEYSRSLRERESLWKKRENLLNLARMIDKEVPLEILKLCDVTPIDWETVTSANGLRIDEFVIPPDWNWDRRQQGEFIIAGRPCQHRIFAHADSKLSFTIPEGVNRFTSVGGVNMSDKIPDGAFRENDPFARYSRRQGRWTYQVWFDGKLYYESGQLFTRPDFSVFIDVPIPEGAKIMTLRTDGLHELYDDHSTWGWPMFHFKEGMKPPTQTAEEVDLRSAPPDFLKKLREIENEIKEKGGFAVAGQVVDENGKSLPRNECFISLVNASALLVLPVVKIAATTDFHLFITPRSFGDGWFITPRQTDKQFDTLVVFPFYHIDQDIPLKVEDGKVLIQKVLLKPVPKDQRTTLSGIIRNEDGKPIPGVQCRLLPRSSLWTKYKMLPLMFPVIMAATDSQGGYSFPDIPRLSSMSQEVYLFPNSPQTSIEPQESYSLFLSHPNYMVAGLTLEPRNTSPFLEPIDNIPSRAKSALDSSGDLVLYYRRRVTMDVVYQPDGTTDFTKSNVKTGRFVLTTYGDSETQKLATWDNPSSGNRVYLDLDSPPFSLAMTASSGFILGDDTRVKIFSHYNSGLYDLGAVNFESVREADSATNNVQKPPIGCELNHVYVFRTFGGKYAKLVIRDIEIIKPDK